MLNMQMKLATLNQVLHFELKYSYSLFNSCGSNDGFSLLFAIKLIKRKKSSLDILPHFQVILYEDGK
jgi:hypothetical protein